MGKGSKACKMKKNATKSLTKTVKTFKKTGKVNTGSQKIAGKPRVMPSKKRATAVEKARTQFLEEKQMKETTRDKKNKERDAAMERAEKRREDKAKLNKALKTKSKSGQPMMNVRMQHLLEKIENNPKRYGSDLAKWSSVDK